MSGPGVTLYACPDRVVIVGVHSVADDAIHNQGRDRMQRKTRIITEVAVLASGRVLALSEDAPDTASADTAKPSTGVPTPDAAQTAAPNRTLSAIDPGLTEKE
ncbi:hypothetical protein ACVNF4_10475 [Streptomyces sp. S6]